MRAAGCGDQSTSERRFVLRFARDPVGELNDDRNAVASSAVSVTSQCVNRRHQARLRNHTQKLLLSDENPAAGAELPSQSVHAPNETLPTQHFLLNDVTVQDHTQSLNEWPNDDLIAIGF
jgi:hypothetical protein